MDDAFEFGGALDRMLEEVVAPRDGVILFITTSPAVAADGLLLGLGADFAPA